MRNNRVCLVALVGAAFAACSDPLSSCRQKGGCEVVGPHLTIDAVDVLQPTTRATDPVTRLPVIPGGTLRAEIVVRNRGDTIAPPASAYVVVLHSDVTTGIPALEPGERFRDTVTIALPHILRASATASPADLRHINVDSIYVRLYGVNGAMLPDEDGASSPFHVALPIITGGVTLVSRSDVHLNQPFVLAFNIRNLSVHDARLPATDFALCLWDFDVGCSEGNWTYSGRFTLPPIDAGQSYENALQSSLNTTAAWQDVAADYHLALCSLPPGHTTPYMTAYPGRTCISYPQPIRVRPDYDACNPPLLSPNVSVTLSAPNCGVLPPPVVYARTEFFLFAIDVVAGQRFRLESPRVGPLVLLYDERGEPAADIVASDGVAFAAAGRYYAVVYGRAPVTLTLRSPG